MKNLQENETVLPFAVKDCALIALSTGLRAHNLRELGVHLGTVSAGSIYYHFWGGLLRPWFDDPEYMNDFAAWARHSLHDKRLAERLAIIDPTEYTDLEELRHELIDVIESRIDESEVVPWASADQLFYFMESQIVVFDTGIRVEEPLALAEVIPKLAVGSIFYHFIDARRRNASGRNDFSHWLGGLGPEHATLMEQISNLDPYFSSLTELRKQLAATFLRQIEGVPE